MTISVRLPALLGAVFWVPLFLRPFWPAALWAFGVIMTIGWLDAAASGRLARLPIAVVVLIGYVVAQLAYNGWLVMVVKGTVPGLLLFPVGCVLVGVASVQWMGGWTPEDAAVALTSLRWSLAVMVCWGWWQTMNLDPFSSRAGGTHHDFVMGTLGNPTLFAHLIAMSLPLWLTWKHRFAGGVSFLAGLLILRSNSVTATLVLVAFVGWYTMRAPKMVRGVLVGLAVVGMVFAVLWWGLFGLPPDYLNPFGRYGAWRAFFDLWRTGPTVTGIGLGSVWALGQTWPASHPLFQWAHVHNEMLSLLVELGALGALAASWVAVTVSQHWRRLAPDAQFLYGGILVASCLCAQTSFPWHITQTALLTLWAMSRVLAEGADHGLAV